MRHALVNGTLMIGCVLVATFAWPHGGGLDASGCHTNRKTGDYHCHRAPAPPPARDSAALPLVSTNASPARGAPHFETGFKFTRDGRCLAATDPEYLTIHDFAWFADRPWCERAAAALAALDASSPPVVSASIAALDADAPPPVKLSRTGICHEPGTRFYTSVTRFAPFKSLAECIRAGGRLPR